MHPTSLPGTYNQKSKPTAATNIGTRANFMTLLLYFLHLLSSKSQFRLGLLYIVFNFKCLHVLSVLQNSQASKSKLTLTNTLLQVVYTKQRVLTGHIFLQQVSHL